MNIDPTQYTLTSTITKVYTRVLSNFTIYVIDFVLNSYVIFCITVYDTNGNVYDSFQIKLEGDDYNNWGSSDTYITSYVDSYIQSKYSN